MKAWIWSILLLLAAPVVHSAEPTPASTDRFIEFDGLLRIDGDFNPNENGRIRENLRFQKFEIGATIHVAKNFPFKLAKEMLFIVKTRMEQDVVLNGILKANHLSVTDYLKEAYIQFNEVGGLPVAVVVGTMEITYGQDYDGTFSLQNDVNHAMSDPDVGQIKGFTVTLDKSVKYLFDKIELSMFSSQGDVKKSRFNQMDGFAFRVTKKLGDHLEFEVSAMHKENHFVSDLQPETKMSFGGIYKNGAWVVWSEFFVLKNSEAYPDARFGGTAGISKIVGPGRAVFNRTVVGQTLEQYAVGYDLYASQNWTIGPTARNTKCRDGNAGCVVARGYGQGWSLGVSARYAFGADRENPMWFSKSKLERLAEGIAQAAR